ncbi:MAG: aromatic ring-hydroxylating dioxygenase subunit alpha [Betaproteobacteria bacterium]|nr:MAG: aromatic ring-hydroxylating dioxygenase subunit alpha [Betaproteobacteria bacterium]
MNLRDSWYVAAWDHEVQRLKLMRRLLLGEPVVLYRKGDGAPVALEDRCCHRHAPLSQGRLRGDRLECGYHGLQFDASGACVHIPAQDRIPASARVRSYPVVEKCHWIWIWMGDPARADPALIPDFGVLSHPDWSWRGERLEVEGSYLLVIENLMDLTHLPALHVTTLADTAIPANEIPVDYRIEPDRILVERWVLDTPVPAYFRLLASFGKEERVDRWMNTVFTPPGFVRIDIGAARTGTGARKGDRSHAVTTWNLNAITPETERTSHYFWAQAQNFSKGDPSITELDFQLVHTAFQEDLRMIKGQQQNIDLAPDAPRLNLSSDRAGIQARRMIERLIREEQERAPATPVKA